VKLKAPSQCYPQMNKNTCDIKSHKI